MASDELRALPWAPTAYLYVDSIQTGTEAVSPASARDVDRRTKVDAKNESAFMRAGLSTRRASGARAGSRALAPPRPAAQPRAQRLRRNVAVDPGGRILDVGLEALQRAGRVQPVLDPLVVAELHDRDRPVALLLDPAQGGEQRAVAPLVEVVVGGVEVDAAQVGDEHAGVHRVVAQQRRRRQVDLV